MSSVAGMASSSPPTSPPKQSPTSGAVNQCRQHHMVIYFRCSLLGCDLNFKNVTTQTKKNQKKPSPPGSSWRSGCHTNRPMISFCLLRGEEKQRVAFPLDSRALFNCLLHKIKFISRYRCGGLKRDGAHNHGTVVNSVSVFCVIRKHRAETTDSDGTLVAMCFFVCLWDSESACYLCSLHVVYRTGISMQDHTVGNTQVGPVRQTNCIQRWRTGNWFQVSVPNMQKSLPIVAFVLNAWVRQCGELQIHSGRRKIPNQNSLSGIMISPLGRSDG